MKASIKRSSILSYKHRERERERKANYFGRMIHHRRSKNNNVFFLTVFIFLIHQQLLNLVLTLCPTSSLLKTSTTRISSTTTLSQQKNEHEDDFFFPIDATEYVETEFDSIYEEAREQQRHHHNGQKQRQEEEDQISKYYNRDDDDDINIPVPDPIGLRKLLKIRFFANKERNTTKVQQIDETLKVEHGVLVYDKPNVWTRRSQTKPPISEIHRRSRNDMAKLQTTYGPTGHPFQQYGGPIDPIYCLLDINQIHNLLSRWIQCRNLNLYEEADAIRFELQLHGVYFDPHRSNLWRADGEKSFPPTADGSSNDSNKFSNSLPQLYHFKKIQSSTSVDPPTFNNNILNFTRIEQLVGIRSSTLCRGENIKAKFLEYEVWKAYGIGIDDNTKTYFVVSSSSGLKETAGAEEGCWEPPTLPTRINHEDRAQTSSSLLPFPPILFENQNILAGKYEFKGGGRYSVSSNNQKNNEDFCDDVISIEGGSERQFVMDRVQHLLEVRKIKLDERKFIEANAILYELDKTYGVVVNDKALEWDVKNIN